MTIATRPSSLLFEMPGNDLTGTPQAVTPVSFADVGALEVQHIERWIAAKPELLGERLLVVTTQFAGFDRTRDRSDILALDEAGKLVVIELKRESDSRQDLQALRYAAYSATLRVDDLVELYVAHRARHGEESPTGRRGIASSSTPLTPTSTISTTTRSRGSSWSRRSSQSG